jgi:palmitoyl-protein thioesterase
LGHSSKDLYISLRRSPTDPQFGAPHYGISALIPCPDPPTLSCKLAARAAKAGIYTTWAQTHLIQAQYYRDGARLDEFLFRNTFIRDMNGEGVLDPEAERGDGGNGLGQLENLVAVAFKEDTTLYPATSAHWGSVAENGTLLEMKDQLLYADDWIGLKRLDEEDKLHLRWCPGQHMELGGEGGCADKLVDKWVGWKK